MTHEFWYLLVPYKGYEVDDCTEVTVPCWVNVCSELYPLYAAAGIGY